MDGSMKFGAVVGVVVVALAGVLIVRRDKAEVPYNECLVASQKDKLDDARDACDRAVSADPESTSGKKAKAQLEAISAKVADDEKKTNAALQARLAAQRAQDERDAKCTKWKTICTTGRHPDGSERTTGAVYSKTKDECANIGAQFGNIPCDPCRCAD